MRARAVAIALAASGCSIPDHFVCHANDQCGSGGYCIGDTAAGTCAFADPTCTSQVRYLDADCVPFTPRHLGTTTIGTGDLVLSTGTLDTKIPDFGSLPAGVTLTLEPQGTGPELAVLHAHSITIPATAVVSVIGTRPLVLVAVTIDIAGTLDVGAHASSPGAGLSTTSGPGTGGAGRNTNQYSDSGGGGGGFGTDGAKGGDSGCTAGGCTTAVGGSGGTSSGDALTGPLLPGFAGGDAVAQCGVALGGSGGGAVQLSAVASITIAGNVLAGGGGGGGGIPGTNCNWGAGGGGGSGGTIMIQAPQITITGTLAANGGAGGSGAGGGGGGNPGLAGEDGGASNKPAKGGNEVGGGGTHGGDGAAGTIAAMQGGGNTTTSSNNYNGGGGGAGVGRIALIGSAATAGARLSPTPVTAPN